MQALAYYIPTLRVSGEKSDRELPYVFEKQMEAWDACLYARKLGAVLSGYITVNGLNEEQLTYKKCSSAGEFIEDFSLCFEKFICNSSSETVGV